MATDNDTIREVAPPGWTARATMLELLAPEAPPKHDTPDKVHRWATEAIRRAVDEDNQPLILLVRGKEDGREYCPAHVLPVGLIRTDGGTQFRKSMKQDVIAEYGGAPERGVTLPPIDVGFDGENLWLIEGFHRHAGAVLANWQTIMARVIKATLEECRWLALAANKSHGVRRDAADLDNCILEALKLRADAPDGEIAEHVGVHRTTVMRRRRELEASGATHKTTRRKGRDGVERDVTKIGKAKAAAPAEQARAEQPKTPEADPQQQPDAHDVVGAGLGISGSDAAHEARANPLPPVPAQQDLTAETPAAIDEPHQAALMHDAERPVAAKHPAAPPAGAPDDPGLAPDDPGLDPFLSLVDTWVASPKEARTYFLDYLLRKHQVLLPEVVLTAARPLIDQLLAMGKLHVGALPPGEVAKVATHLLRVIDPSSALSPETRKVGSMPPLAPQRFRGPDIRTSLPDLIATGRRFGTIYADPPWRYRNQGTRSATRNHYPTLGIEDIIALPVAHVCAENAVCHLWATAAFFPECFRILDAWGFRFVESFAWLKPRLGLGNYWRIAHEHLLLGLKGDPPVPKVRFRSYIVQPRAGHSAKPERVRQLVQAISPSPYLELFARRRAPGWTSLGNEAPA